MLANYQKIIFSCKQCNIKLTPLDYLYSFVDGTNIEQMFLLQTNEASNDNDDHNNKVKSLRF